MILLAPRSHRLLPTVALALALGMASLGAQAQTLPGEASHWTADRMGAGDMHGGGHGPAAFAHKAERMLDAVKATPEQRTQIRQLMQAAQADMKAQRETQQALRKQQDALFVQPNVDARAVEALRLQSLAQVDQSSRRMTQLRLDIARVLSPEQRQQLQERRNQRMELRERHLRERRALDGGAAPR